MLTVVVLQLLHAKRLLLRRNPRPVGPPEGRRHQVTFTIILIIFIIIMMIHLILIFLSLRVLTGKPSPLRL